MQTKDGVEWNPESGKFLFKVISHDGLVQVVDVPEPQEGKTVYDYYGRRISAVNAALGIVQGVISHAEQSQRSLQQELEFLETR